MSAGRQSTRFLLLYALAWAGGTIAYMPLLTVLLPVRVAALAGEASVGWLAYLAFAGAIAASLANVACGWLSDLYGGRRLWIAAGMVITCALLPWFDHAATFAQLLGLLIAWQVSLNLMLAPMAALAGDCVPDAQKGTLGGMLAFAPAAGAAAGSLVTFPGIAGPEGRLIIVAVLVCLAVLPILLIGRPHLAPLPRHQQSAAPPTAPDRQHPVVRMWFARLLVQVSEAALFAFLYLWLRSLDPNFDDATTARLFLVVLAVGAPVALITGRWADRTQQPLRPLRITALLAASGLLVMALGPGVYVALAGYVLFTLATGVFLSLHSAQTLRVLRRSDRRGRDLGFFNLTNTVPSLVMPWLTLALVPQLGFAALFSALAVLGVGAAILLATIASR